MYKTWSKNEKLWTTCYVLLMKNPMISLSYLLVIKIKRYIINNTKKKYFYKSVIDYMCLNYFSLCSYNVFVIQLS
jgi:hypothetical protein